MLGTRRLLPLLALAVAATGLNATDSIYIRFPGTTGESLDKAHPGSQGWSEVLAFGHCSSRSGGPAQACEVSLLKNIGRQTTVLIDNMLKGKSLNTTPYAVTLEVCRSGATSPFCYYKIELREVFITSLSQSANSGGDIINDSLSMSFTAIKWTHTPQNPDGTPGTPTTACWDFAANAAICY